MNFAALMTTGLFSAGAAMLAVPAHATPGQVEIANPASEYCVSIGGESFTRKTPSGDIGYCRLPNGKVEEEWALFRRSQTPSKPKKPRNGANMANPAAVYCGQIGGTNLNRKTRDGDVALCRLRNGKTVGAWDLFRRANDKDSSPRRPTAEVGMANPASVHCLKMKGRLVMGKGPNSSVGYCHLPNGRVVEEWKLFREQSNGRAG